MVKPGRAHQRSSKEVTSMVVERVKTIGGDKV